MLSVEEAKQVGKTACIEKIGRENYEKYGEFSCFAWGENTPGILTCSVGMNKTSSQSTKLMLTSGKEWDFFVACDVNMQDGNIEDMRVKLK